MTDLTALSVAQARDALKKKNLSAAEITDAHIDAIEKARKLNAFVLETPEIARAMAKESDRRIAQGNGEWLPELAVTWRHDHALDDGDVTASYVGAPGTAFTVDGEENQRDSVQVGLGVGSCQALAAG